MGNIIDVKKNIRILFKAGVPVKLLADFYNINEHTVRRDLSEELEMSRDTPQEGLSVKKVTLLQIYAWLLVDALDCAIAIGTPEIVNMKKSIFSYLQLRDWVMYIEGVILYKKIAEGNNFSAGVSEGYRRLINDLCPSATTSEINAVKVLESFLIVMHKGKIPFPESMNSADFKKTLDAYITKELVSTNRYFDEIFIVWLDDMCQKYLEGEALAVIYAYYGIYRFTTDEVLEMYNISQDSFEKIKHRKMGRLKQVVKSHISDMVSDCVDTLKSYSLLTKKYMELEEKLESVTKQCIEAKEKLESQRIDLEKEVQSVMQKVIAVTESLTLQQQLMLRTNPEVKRIFTSYFPETFLGESDKVFLRRILSAPLGTLGLSVGACNRLYSCDIHSLGQLVACTEGELSWIGWEPSSSYITEIREIFQRAGLYFGMKIN